MVAVETQPHAPLVAYRPVVEKTKRRSQTLLKYRLCPAQLFGVGHGCSAFLTPEKAVTPCYLNAILFEIEDKRHCESSTTFSASIRCRFFMDIYRVSRRSPAEEETARNFFDCNRNDITEFYNRVLPSLL